MLSPTQYNELRQAVGMFLRDLADILDPNYLQQDLLTDNLDDHLAKESKPEPQPRKKKNGGGRGFLCVECGMWTVHNGRCGKCGHLASEAATETAEYREPTQDDIRAAESRRMVKELEMTRGRKR
jgi:hypothetical protein